MSYTGHNSFAFGAKCCIKSYSPSPDCCQQFLITQICFKPALP